MQTARREGEIGVPGFPPIPSRQLWVATFREPWPSRHLTRPFVRPDRRSIYPS